MLPVDLLPCSNILSVVREHASGILLSMMLPQFKYFIVYQLSRMGVRF